MFVAQRLKTTVESVCPIDGVSIGVIGDPATVRIDFKDTATAPQKTAAQSTLTSFDWSDAAQVAWEAAQKPELTAIQQAAATAVSGNTTFLGVAVPSAAPTLAQVQTLWNQVRALSQQNNKIIPRLIQLTQ